MNAKQKFWTLIVIYQLLLIIAVFSSVSGLITLVAAQGVTGGAQNPMVSMVLAISAAASVSAAVFASAFAIKTVGTAAISALSEREEAFFKAFLVVALAEALAVYGLIIAILLWTKI